jgi:hypothetical protein
MRRHKDDNGISVFLKQGRRCNCRTEGLPFASFNDRQTRGTGMKKGALSLQRYPTFLMGSGCKGIPWIDLRCIGERYSMSVQMDRRKARLERC